MENDLISRSALKDALEYWTNFPKHRGGKSVYDIIDDAPVVDAVVLSKEDTAFLVALQHELLTQPTDGNRDPRFWGVIEEKKEFGYSRESGEGWAMWDSENFYDVGAPNDIQSVIDELTDPDNYGYDLADFEDVDMDDPEEVADRVGELGSGFTVEYYRTHHVVSEDHLFLTKKACREYIDKFGYNHTNPHTYVMTAERCPEYERLLKILKETNWRGDK